MLFERANGVLMHISSLPAKYGIGTLGKEAYQFVDFLKSAGQKYWQILPLCPTSYGDSPYQSFSIYAGNTYFIDLDKLCLDGYLKESDYQEVDFGQGDRVDYERLYNKRTKILSVAAKRFSKNIPEDFNSFCKKNEFWLKNYALFMAIKSKNPTVTFSEWKKDICNRQERAIKKLEKSLKRKIQNYKIEQYLFYKQWFELKKYANRQGIKIIGDIPIYVAADSADVWASPEQFCLDDNKKPIEVAGCPPDAFSEDGQLWGNPIYDWDYMKKDDYSWWLLRLKFSLDIYDVVRIDHFRGFENYYCIPSSDTDAKNGIWRNGPSIDFWNEAKRRLGELPIIAEDLGYLTPEVIKLVEDSGFPGMKVLQFAFDSRENNDYLPENYGENCVVYTGTHDNDTILGWTQSAFQNDVKYAKRYLGAQSNIDLVEKMMAAAMESKASLCILTMQDILLLDGRSRMNIPSTLGGNWVWRVLPNQITDNIADNLYKKTKEAKRI